MAYESYSAPVYDENRVQSLTQTSAAGAIRGLRSAMQGLAGGSFANPNVRRMTLRDALAGYGQGLQSAMSSASDTARGLYNTEYAARADAAKVNYQGGLQQALQEADIANRQKLADKEIESNRLLTEYKAAQDRRNLEYKAEQDRSNIEYQAGENRYNTTYAAAENRKNLEYQAGENRYLTTEKIGADRSNLEYSTAATKQNIEYQTLWNNFNATAERDLKQQQIGISQQELKIKQQEAETNKALAEAKLNPYGYGITRPPKGLDAYANARWYADHGIG